MPAIAVVVLGFVLRVLHLGRLPNGLFCDEAANGLDAWSLLTTGRSLHGEAWPLFLQHHGIDWVEPLYTWSLIPSVALLGRTALAVRLPAALAGALTLLAVWLLVRCLAGGRTALFAAALTALSPWHLVLSRVGYRGILLPLAMVLAAWLFVSGIEAPRWRWPLAGLALGVALWTYSVARAFVPLALVALLLAYARPVRAALRDRAARRAALLAALVLVALAAPLYGAALWGTANARFDEISIFAHPRPVARLAMNLLLQLDPLFLFLDGDADPRAGIGGFGQGLAALAPLVLWGAWRARRDRGARLALLLFGAGAVPPALTASGVPHALRGIGSAPWLEVLAAIGLAEMLRWAAEGGGGRRLVAAGALAAIGLNAALFLGAYFSRYPGISAEGFQHGWQQAIAVAETEGAAWDRVLLSPRENQPYVFPLYFGGAGIETFQSARSLGRYEALDPERSGRRMEPGRYGFVAMHCEEVKGAPAREVATVPSPRGDVSLRLYEVVIEEPTWVGLAKRKACGSPREVAGWRWARRVTRSYRAAVHDAFGLPRIAEG
jgi:4-amino-4-deoxy-L-arabinose transferase-like glycosyltransferase